MGVPFGRGPRWAWVLAAVFLLAGAYAAYAQLTLIEVHHLPARYGRRAHTLTANITGEFSSVVRDAQYRLNEGEWRTVGRGWPRAPFPLFVIELDGDELATGTNRIDIRAEARGRSSEERTFQFEYDPAPVPLPIRRTWEDGDLEAQDGKWERFQSAGGWRVRPAPGHEGYDRLLVVAPAFAGGRRVETTVVFRFETGRGKPFGFGVLPLWAGHPEESDHRPRRGWRFSLAWYYSHYDAIGGEFSDKVGGVAPPWVSTYRSFVLQPDVAYRIIVEAWPELDEAGKHRRFVQRFKWWRDGEEQPPDWMELSDELRPLAAGEYAVALNSHRSQVEFGPVTVTAIDTGAR